MFSKMFCVYVLAAAQIASVCCGAVSVQLSGKTSKRARVRVESFGKTPDGEEVFLYEMVNANGIRARVIDYGAILVSLEVPDRKGKLADIALGFDDLDSYVKRKPLFGAVVGRYANRIENARPPTQARTIFTAVVRNGLTKSYGKDYQSMIRKGYA